METGHNGFRLISGFVVVLVLLATGWGIAQKKPKKPGENPNPAPPCFDAQANRYADCGNGTVTDSWTDRSGSSPRVWL